MKLEKLGPNFSLMNQEEQRTFFIQYTEKRALDLAEIVTIKKKKSGSTKGRSLTVTTEALEILKKLGLVL